MPTKAAPSSSSDERYGLTIKRRPIRYGAPSFARRLGKWLIVCGILLGLVVGVAYAYTWYIGQHPGKNAYQDTPTIDPPKTPKATTPNENANVGVAAEALTSPAAPGSDAQLSIKTLPGAECSIKEFMADQPISGYAFDKQTSDEFGLINWSWTVPTSTATGNHQLKVTCVRGKKSGFLQADLCITRNPDQPCPVSGAH